MGRMSSASGMRTTGRSDLAGGWGWASRARMSGCNSWSSLTGSEGAMGNDGSSLTGSVCDDWADILADENENEDGDGRVSDAAFDDFVGGDEIPDCF